MPRVKNKKPIRVNINNEREFSSPHLLDLRQLYFNQQQPEPSFEEKALKLDQKIKKMPDFVKERAAILSSLLEQEANSFFSKAARLGAKLHKSFVNTGIYKPRPIKQNIPRFVIIVALILFVTIPLQGLFLYKSINNFQSDIASSLDKTTRDADTFVNAIQSRELLNINSQIATLQTDVAGMRSILDRLGIFKIFLPDKFKFADHAVRVAERGLSSLYQLSNEAIDLKNGNSNPGELIRTTKQELAIFNEQLDKMIGRYSQAKVLEPILANLNSGKDMATVAEGLYGSKEQKNILLIFQNPRELRATGGFAGSFALIKIQDGIIKSIAAPEGGAYAIQGQMPIDHISPRPLHLINPSFEFQDANWWPDFPTSAKKIVELFEASGQPTVDGVIAITANVGEEILKLNGSIQSEQGIINSDNFIDVLQSTILRDRGEDRSAPKKIITALIPIMRQAVLSTASKKPMELINSTFDSLRSKNIQIWSRDENVQSAIQRLGWSGKLSQTSGDYIAVITSNVGGGKTDGVVQEKLDHEIYIDYSGLATEKLHITRKHNGRKGDIFTGHDSYAYTRIYVPENARLIKVEGNNPPEQYKFEQPSDTSIPDPDVRVSESSMTKDVASGSEIWNESGKKVFGVWLRTKAGEQSEITITYEVPFKLSDRVIPYSLTIDPQGGKTSELSSKITLADGLRVLTGNNEWKASGWEFNGNLNNTIVASSVLYRL